jgi:hypothetical protein
LDESRLTGSLRFPAEKIVSARPNIKVSRSTVRDEHRSLLIGDYRAFYSDHPCRVAGSQSAKELSAKGGLFR